MTSGRAIVIGGSLAGLLVGLLMRRGGFAVDIYERATAGLAGRGAGIVIHPMLEEVLDAAAVPWQPEFSVGVATRRCFDRSGRLMLECGFPQHMTGWDRLYDMLRGPFPSSHYHLGKELLRVEPRPHGVAAHFADGTAVAGDVLIGADGLRSTVRARLLPAIAPHYAGYAAWRALVPEGAIPPNLQAQVFDHMAFCLPPGEQMLGYPVAGPGNDLRPGHRRYNLVWYRPADEATDLQRLLTDEAGVTHAVAIPPPLISRAVIGEMHAAADAVLAPQFRDLIRLAGAPMLQAIYDLESPRMAFDRVAIIGDAAFVARPHVGAGVAKAARDALTLTRALERSGDVEAALRDLEAAQVPFGRRIVARARALGACLQQRHADAIERGHAERFRSPAATLAETATLRFLSA